MKRPGACDRSEKPLRGNTEPRIFTPPRGPLTPETSRGFAAIKFAEQILGLTLFPWQKWVLTHALETNEDGTYRFRTVVLLVARQNGKSSLLLVLALWRMFVEGSPLVIGTAQNLDIAEELWTEAYQIAEDIPELADLIEHVNKTNGKKALVLTTGERYKVAAASRRGGRGLTGDLVLLDELREHQTWAAWSAVTKTTMARSRAQIWAASNAGDAASLVLRHLRMQAHLALGDPDGINTDPVTGESLAVDQDPDARPADSLALFEYSAPPGVPIWDRDGWAAANPSLNHTDVTPDVITDRAIAAAAATDPEWEFRTEVLCQWFAGAVDGPFPPGSWQLGKDDLSAIAEGEPVVACIDVSWDRTLAHIAFAGLRDDGVPHVEIVASRAGTDWVLDWLSSPDRSREIRGVVWQKNGAPVSSLTSSLEASDLPLIPWAGPDLARATGFFYDRVRAGLAPIDGGQDEPGVYHRSQPVLDVPAHAAVVKPSGDSWLWDRAKSPCDASPLVAATGAVWGLLSQNAEERRSAYEESDLLVLD